MQTSKHILVFDSGVGGLTLVKHIRAQLPQAKVTYLADNACFPYGTLNEHKLVQRTVDLVVDVCYVKQPDLVVIGCNSASTLVLPSLRKQLAIPVVGVVPAVKPAATKSQTKVIGLLATPGTIQRDYTDGLIKDFANDCQIIRVGSNELVEAIEKKLSGVDYNDKLFDKITQQFSEQLNGTSMDTVVLACTHFPHAQKELQTAMPFVKHWVDSGQAIAQRITTLLAEQTHHGSNNTTNCNDFAYFTSSETLTSSFKENLKQFGFHNASPWPTNH